jgi:hypothetical protein
MFASRPQASSGRTANGCRVVSTECGKLLETGAKIAFDRSWALELFACLSAATATRQVASALPSLAKLDPSRDPPR